MRALPQRVRALGAALALLLAAPAAAARVATLRVGTSGDYPPFSFPRARGATAAGVGTPGFSGFDIAVARRLARDLGRQIEVIPFRWPELLDDLRRHAFDIAMSGVTIRPDRAMDARFTRPYVVSSAVAVVRLRDRTRFGRRTSLDRAGVRIAVNAGGHLERVARQAFPRAHIIAVTDNRALPDWLRRGAADAAVADTLEVQTWTGAQFAAVATLSRDRKAYALPAGATALQRQVDNWLAARETDGWLNRQRRRWLGRRAGWTPQRSGFEALASAIDLRLQLMPSVAAVKRYAGLPVEDPAQEAHVLAGARRSATAAGLNADDVAAFFRLQIDLAKEVERSATRIAAVPVPGENLGDLRAAIGAVSAQLIAELSRCQPWIAEPRRQRELETVMHAGLRDSGVPAAGRRRLIAALRHIRLAQPPARAR